MTTNDALVAALLTAAAQVNLALEHAKDRRLSKIAERLRHTASWLNSAIALAATDTISTGDTQ